MRKMMECKTCGAQIAKSAKVCPQCGAKQHTAALTACCVIIVFTVFAIFLVVSRGLSGELEDSGAQSGSTPVQEDIQNGDVQEDMEPASIEITATQLWTAYSENEVAAADMYEGETLLISGTIQDISEDIITNKPCITLSSGDSLGIYGIQCFFKDDSSREAISKLSDGEYITIKGRCTGKVVVIQLNDCILS